MKLCGLGLLLTPHPSQTPERAKKKDRLAHESSVPWTEAEKMAVTPTSPTAPSKNTIPINNPADISVIVIYFVVVLAVGVWVSVVLA